MSIQKSEIKISANGKPVKAYLAAPETGGPGVLVLHAWWGLNPFIKDLCGQLAEKGFTALAPDLFQGQVAKTIEAAKALAKNSKDEIVSDIVMAAKDYLLAHTKGNIGMIGYSYGAAQALVTAAQDSGKISAMVLFYGVYEVDFSELKTKILGHFGDHDEMEPLDGAREMEKAMRAAGVEVTLQVYPGVSHWFAETDRPEYNPAAAKLAWNRTIDFLKKNIA